MELDLPYITYFRLQKLCKNDAIDRRGRDFEIKVM